MKVLFVCTGNICRSPMGEVILRDKLKKMGVKYIKVSSAGVDCPHGWEITPEAKTALKKRGYKITKHKSTPAQSLNLNEYKIYTLTERHKQALGIAAARSARDVIGSDIADPWMLPQSVYDECCGQIENFCNAILDEIVIVEGEK